jgi:hypothetical protein
MGIDGKGKNSGMHHPTGIPGCVQHSGLLDRIQRGGQLAYNHGGLSGASSKRNGAKWRLESAFGSTQSNSAGSQPTGRLTSLSERKKDVGDHSNSKEAKG